MTPLAEVIEIEQPVTVLVRMLQTLGRIDG